MQAQQKQNHLLVTNETYAIKSYDKYFTLKIISNADTATTIIEEADNELTINMKTRVIVGIQTMTEATQSVFEWCKVAKTIIASDEKNQFMELIDDGIETMNAARHQLQNSSRIFNTATGKLIAIQYHFDNEVQANQKYLQNKSSQKVIDDFKGVFMQTEKFYKYLKRKIAKAFRDIGELKLQADKVKFNAPNSDDDSAESTASEHSNNIAKSGAYIIAKCNDFNAIAEEDEDF